MNLSPTYGSQLNHSISDISFFSSRRLAQWQPWRRKLDICDTKKKNEFVSPALHVQSPGKHLSTYSMASTGLDTVPKHVAIIMDGNSRWAESKGLPRELGHLRGVQVLKEIVRLSDLWQIQVLTLFAFSTENWLRSENEVQFLMNLFEEELRREMPSLLKENVNLRVVGDLSQLPVSLQELIRQSNESFSSNSGLKINLAMNYGGRQDLLTAVRRIAARVASGDLVPLEITEKDIEAELATAWLGSELSSPDLLIRTSGELRLSNFLLWQTAYSELYFSDVLWPDFGETQYREALLEFQKRERRYGMRNSARIRS